MKKILIIVGLLLVVFSGVYLLQQKSMIPSVFQTPYRTKVRTEFETLMEEKNIKVSDANFWTTPVGGRTARAELEKQASILYKKYILLDQEARKNGYPLAALDLKNTDWQTISKRYTELKQWAIDQRLKTVTFEQVKTYYQEHQEKYYRQDTVSGYLAIWQGGIVVSQEKIEISEQTVRIMTESYPELEVLLKDISVGQQVSWQQDGKHYSFTCEHLEEKGVMPLTEITDAVAIQYAESMVDQWLESNSKS